MFITSTAKTELIQTVTWDRAKPTAYVCFSRYQISAPHRKPLFQLTPHPPLLYSSPAGQGWDSMMTLFWVWSSPSTGTQKAQWHCESHDRYVVTVCPDSAGSVWSRMLCPKKTSGEDQQQVSQPSLCLSFTLQVSSGLCRQSSKVYIMFLILKCLQVRVLHHFQGVLSVLEHWGKRWHTRLM